MLHAYWTTGVFPHNHDFPGERRPYFVDRHGTRCAMAYLIEHAGGAALVHRVAATANNARVQELAGDPELVAWLDRNGMTADEAARVQPSYGYVAPNPRGLADPYTAWAVAALTAEATGIAVNVPRSWPWKARRLAGTFGFIGGAAGVATGAATISHRGALGDIEILGGILTFALALVNLNSPPDEASRLAAAHLPAWRAHPELRIDHGGDPQLAVRVGF